VPEPAAGRVDGPVGIARSRGMLECSDCWGGGAGWREGGAAAPAGSGCLRLLCPFTKPPRQRREAPGWFRRRERGTVFGLAPLSRGFRGWGHEGEDSPTPPPGPQDPGLGEMRCLATGRVRPVERGARGGRPAPGASPPRRRRARSTAPPRTASPPRRRRTRSAAPAPGASPPRRCRARSPLHVLYAYSCCVVFPISHFLLDASRSGGEVPDGEVALIIR
jgi:hypothetical protein